MKGQKTGGRDWQPGISGNNKGRPRAGNTLKEVLDHELQKKKGKKTKKQIIIKTIVNLAIGGDLRAIERIIAWDESRYQFDIKTSIVERLEVLEDIVNERTYQKN